MLNITVCPPAGTVHEMQRMRGQYLPVAIAAVTYMHTQAQKKALKKEVSVLT